MDWEQQPISRSRLTLSTTKMFVCVIVACVRQADYGSGEARNRSDETMGIRSTSKMLRVTRK